ncbi:MAG: indole-3-glycerol phosphate synthase TrpC [Kiritimatiellae bacterium]|nr:indole-3-glycerol phosphate synthase TrpC [Kiritimatiellia bacterium]
MDVLQKILARRREDVAAAKRRVPLRVLEEESRSRIHHSLSRRLEETRGTRIIAEMKKASPSAGSLRADYDPAALARSFADGGAVAVSVLTEPHYFMGSEEHLREARRSVNLPVLRKDFVCDAYQIVEAAAWGADVVLLIVAALEKAHLRELYDTARSFGLEVLAEAHAPREVETALSLSEAIVGINSRNLRTLQIDLGVARAAIREIPPGRPAVAESGIRSRADVEELEGLGYRGFLIGEVLMRGPNPLAKLRELRGEG